MKAKTLKKEYHSKKRKFTHIIEKETGNEDLNYIQKLYDSTCMLAKTAVTGNSME
jgi:hypothetical protein